MVDDWSQVFPVLKALKENGWKTSRSAGSHIHVSFEDGRPIDASSVKRLFVKRYGKTGYSHRKNVYANYNLSADQHYSAVRQVERHHIEFRMFDGTLRGHAVNNYFRMVRLIMLDSIRLNLQPSEQHWLAS